MTKLSDSQLEEKYELIKKYHKEYLDPLGIKLPKLKWGKSYTEKALTLIC